MKALFVKLFQKSAMKKPAEPRTVTYKNIGNVRSCGFLFSSDEPFIVNTVQTLETLLKQHQITYKGRAFNVAKNATLTNKFQSDPNILQIERIDVNWYGIAKEEYMNEFLAQPFDLLIDLSREAEVPFALKYALIHSKASFKIGFHPDHEPYYDLTLRPSDKKGQQSDDIVKSIFSYLSDIR